MRAQPASRRAGAPPPDTAPSEGLLQREARRARPGQGTREPVRGWPIAAAITVVLVFLYYVRDILLPFVLAAAVAFVLTPAVDWLHGKARRLPRWAAALVVYLALFAGLAALGYWGGQLVMSDIARIVRDAPGIVRRTLDQLTGGEAQFLGAPFDAEAVAQQIIDRARAFLVSGTALYFATLGLTAVFSGFLAAVLVLYFLISGGQIVNGTLWLVPPEHRPEVAVMLQKVGPLLRRYLIGLGCIVLYTTGAAWIGFGLLFGLPHAPLLALLVGILELIPVVGPLTSAVLVGVAALQQASLWAAAGLACYAVLLRLSIDQFVGPIVLGRAAAVHPVVVMFAFLSGAVVFGVIGLILAVPVAATIRLVLDHYYGERVEEPAGA